MIHLLDVNPLIALAWPSHVHHAVAQGWFRRKGRKGWATCPLTQTGFVRISSNPKFIDGAVSPSEAVALLTQVMFGTQHEFWPDDLSVAEADNISWSHVFGHRQVTDAYLLALAKHHNGKLATLDEGIAAFVHDTKGRPDSVELVT